MFRIGTKTLIPHPPHRSPAAPVLRNALEELLGPMRQVMGGPKFIATLQQAGPSSCVVDTHTPGPRVRRMDETGCRFVHRSERLVGEGPVRNSFCRKMSQILSHQFLSHRGHGEAPRQVYPEAGMGHTCLRDNERILGSHTLVEARLQRGPRASVP